MIETIGLINNLNKRYPVAIRRFSIGLRTEQEILNEIQNAKRVKYTLLFSSAFLFGVCGTDIFLQTNSRLSPAITILVLALLFIRYLQAVTLHKRYPQNFKENYTITTVNYIDNHISGLRPNVPEYLERFTKNKILKALLKYEKSLVGHLILSGNINKHKLSPANMRKIESIKCTEKLPRQAAMSLLNRIGGPLFVSEVFRSILKAESQKKGTLSKRQFSIAAAKAALATKEVRSLKPSERASVVHKKVKEEFGKCLTSENQIKEGIAKNRHSSLDKILHTFERI